MFTIKIQIPCTVLFHIGNVCSPIFFSGAKSGQVPITIKIHTTMLTEEQKEQEILQAFKAFDRDGNGTISRDELAHVYQHLTNRLPTEHDIDMLMSLISTNHNNEISMEDFVTSMKKYLDRDSEEGISKRKREATYEESRAGVHNKIAKYMLQFEMNSNIDQVYKCFVNNFSRMTDLEEQLDVIINDKSFSDQMKEEVLEDFRKTDLESIAQMLVSSSTLDEEYAALQKCRNALKILTVCASSEERKKIAADIIRIYETFLNMNVVPSLLKSLSRTSDMFVYESLKILCLLIPGPRLDECLPAKHILLYDRKLFKNLIGYSGIPIIAKLIGSNRIKISDKAISGMYLL